MQRAGAITARLSSFAICSPFRRKTLSLACRAGRLIRIRQTIERRHPTKSLRDEGSEIRNLTQVGIAEAR